MNSSIAQFVEDITSLTKASSLNYLVKFIEHHPVLSTLGVLSGIAVTTQLTKKRLPPGPLKLPFVGTTWGYDMLSDFNVLWKKYGGLTSLFMGDYHMIIVQGKEMIREMFIKRKKDFMGRPTTDVAINDLIVAAPYNDDWKNNKRTSLLVMRNFLYNNLEEHFDLCNDALDQLIDESNGEAFNPLFTFKKATLLAGMSLYLGRRHTLHSEEFLHYYNKYLSVPKTVSKVRKLRMSAFLPFSMYFYKDVLEAPNKILVGLREDFKKIYNDAVSRAEDGKEPTNFLESLAKEFKEKTENNVIDTFFVMQFDITQAMSVLLSFTILRLALNPKIQARIHKLLDEKVGNRKATLEDRPQLALIEACFIEALRMDDILTCISPHTALGDQKINGYDIPKETMIMIAADSIHYDPEVFPDPHTYNPDRFIDSNGAVTYKSSEFIAFGIGLRKCIGEQLVRMSTFLILANFLNKYEVKLHGEKPDFSKRCYFDTLCGPPDHKIAFKRRK